jgi:hypothetical protein
MAISMAYLVSIGVNKEKRVEKTRYKKANTKSFLCSEEIE